MLVMTGTTTLAASPDRSPSPPARVVSIDALRGLVMFAMIYVNDIAGASKEIVPWWMRHYPGDSNGMTFVDLVFPAFLFIVGMSIPFALGSRLARGDSVGRILFHVVTRTVALLFIGILMVNGTPDSDQMGWSATLWSALLYGCAILAFGTRAPRLAGKRIGAPRGTWRAASLALRVAGFAGLLLLAFAFRGKDGHRIIILTPFSIHTEWYGILGLIGWAYLVASTVFLLFRDRRTALLGCMVLPFCLYPADRTGTFAGWRLADHVGIGGMLGSHAAITTAGVLLASILRAPDTASVRSRIRFTLLLIAGCSIGAVLLHGLYGINKNSATPSWCLWSCAITAAIWLLLYLLTDVLSLCLLTRPFAIAGENVLLAYLLHNLLYPTLGLLGLEDWYARLAQPDLAHAVGRSAGCAIFVLAVSASLNRIGYRLRL